MKLLNEPAFDRLCGNMIPFQRHVPALIGQTYICACSQCHELTSQASIIAEGVNGQFLVLCPVDPTLVTLVRARTKWFRRFVGLDSIAGHAVDNSLN